MIMLLSTTVSAADTRRTLRSWRMFILWVLIGTRSRIFFVAVTSDERRLTTSRGKNMNIQSSVKAGILWPQHNESLKIATQVRAGLNDRLATNHNEALSR